MTNRFLGKQLKQADENPKIGIESSHEAVTKEIYNVNAVS